MKRKMPSVDSIIAAIVLGALVLWGLLWVPFAPIPGDDSPVNYAVNDREKAALP